jgi:hypothetical protein
VEQASGLRKPAVLLWALAPEVPQRLKPLHHTRLMQR